MRNAFFVNEMTKCNPIINLFLSIINYKIQLERVINSSKTTKCLQSIFNSTRSRNRHRHRERYRDPDRKYNSNKKYTYKKWYFDYYTRYIFGYDYDYGSRSRCHGHEFFVLFMN